MDDALVMLDASVEDLMVMCKDQVYFGQEDFATLDKNVAYLKSYCDQIETKIKQEKR